MKVAILSTDPRFTRAVETLAATMHHETVVTTSSFETESVDVYVVDVATVGGVDATDWHADASRTIAYLPAGFADADRVRAIVAHAPDRSTVMVSLPVILTTYLDAADMIA